VPEGYVYLQISDDLTHGRAGVPVLRYAPDYVGHDADHGYQQIYNRQSDDTVTAGGLILLQSTGWAKKVRAQTHGHNSVTS